MRLGQLSLPLALTDCEILVSLGCFRDRFGLFIALGESESSSSAIYIHFTVYFNRVCEFLSFLLLVLLPLHT